MCGWKSCISNERPRRLVLQYYSPEFTAVVLLHVHTNRCTVLLRVPSTLLLQDSVSSCFRNERHERCLTWAVWTVNNTHRHTPPVSILLLTKLTFLLFQLSPSHCHCLMPQQNTHSHHMSLRSLLKFLTYNRNRQLQRFLVITVGAVGLPQWVSLLFCDSCVWFGFWNSAVSL